MDNPLQNIRVNRLPGGQSISGLTQGVRLPSAQNLNLHQFNNDALLAYWREEVMKLEEKERNSLSESSALSYLQLH